MEPMKTDKLSHWTQRFCFSSVSCFVCVKVSIFVSVSVSFLFFVYVSFLLLINNSDHDLYWRGSVVLTAAEVSRNYLMQKNVIRKIEREKRQT